MTVNLRVLQAREQLARADGPYHEWREDEKAAFTQFYKDGAGYLVRFPGKADFLISANGEDVSGWPALQGADATMDHLFLNVVHPLAMSQQGRLVLHGSAVEIKGAAVAFLGESGMGKSTLATSFAVAGHPFLTDDGLLIDWHQGRCMAHPSHPSVRLWDDSENALVPENAALRAPVLDFTAKARLLAGPDIAFCEQPQPLQLIYFLGDDETDTTYFEPVGFAETVIQLAENAFLLDAKDKDLIAKRFADLARLANQVRFFTLQYPRSYDALPQVRAAIFQHAALNGGKE